MSSKVRQYSAQEWHGMAVRSLDCDEEKLQGHKRRRLRGLSELRSF